MWHFAPHCSSLTQWTKILKLRISVFFPKSLISYRLKFHSNETFYFGNWEKHPRLSVGLCCHGTCMTYIVQHIRADRAGLVAVLIVISFFAVSIYLFICSSVDERWCSLLAAPALIRPPCDIFSYQIFRDYFTIGIWLHVKILLLCLLCNFPELLLTRTLHSKCGT